VKFVVKGLGMIGASLGLALAGQGERVGYDPDPEVRAQALALGAVDEVAADAPDETEAVVFLAGPPRAIWQEVRRGESSARLVLDVASVKAPIVAAAAGGGLPFVGGHPLAGCERQGPAAGSADMFRGQPFFLTPVPGREHLLPRAEEVVRRLGAKPVRMEAAEHDRLLALTSHLPYVLARTLLVLARDVPEVVQGPGFHSLTRPGRSPEALWREILELNRQAVEEAWRKVQAEVEAMLHADA
jgi:prephenate dehydrogenase